MVGSHRCARCRLRVGGVQAARTTPELPEGHGVEQGGVGRTLSHVSAERPPVAAGSPGADDLAVARVPGVAGQVDDHLDRDDNGGMIFDTRDEPERGATNLESPHSGPPFWF